MIIKEQNLINVNNFYDKEIKFKTLQVKTISGLFAKRAKTSIRKYPTRYTNIQINSSDYINALVFDCDHNDVLEFTDYNLPEPTLTIVNKHNGKHHHIYYLENPIPLFCATQKTRDYLKDLVNGMTEILEADTNYTGIITKNFLNHKDFKVFGSLKKYKLNDFVEFTKAQNKLILKKQDIVKEKTETHFSRHLTLFDKLRYFGYSIANKLSYTELENELDKYAQKINDTFETQIKTKYIVKSVLNYCWDNRANLTGSNNWNWNYQKKDKQEVKQSHQNRWKRYREEKYKEELENIKKHWTAMTKRLRFSAIFKLVRNIKTSNKHQINQISLEKVKNTTTKITIRYITPAREPLEFNLLESNKPPP